MKLHVQYALINDDDNLLLRPCTCKPRKRDERVHNHAPIDISSLNIGSADDIFKF